MTKYNISGDNAGRCFLCVIMHQHDRKALSKLVRYLTYAICSCTCLFPAMSVVSHDFRLLWGHLYVPIVSN